jgi:hypothetical protein
MISFKSAKPSINFGMTILMRYFRGANLAITFAALAIALDCRKESFPLRAA